MPPFKPRYGLAYAMVAAVVLAGCDENAAPDDKVKVVEPPHVVRVMPAKEALAGAQIAKVDLETMNDAEIRKVLGEGLHCAFRYTSAGKPVLSVKVAGSAAQGVVKLNGNLVSLNASPGAESLVLADHPVRVSVALVDGGAVRAERIPHQSANAVFEIAESFRVGYGGYYSCPASTP